MARYTATLGRLPPLDFQAETFGFDASEPVLSESMVVAEVGLISIGMVSWNASSWIFGARMTVELLWSSFEINPTSAITIDSLRTRRDASKPNVSARKSSGGGHPKVAVYGADFCQNPSRNCVRDSRQPSKGLISVNSVLE